MRKSRRILLTGGGSGGHIIPNLAVATVIKKKSPSSELRYIASRGKLDADLLRPSGLKYYGIFSGKLRRYFSWQNFVDPILVLLGFFQALFILIRFRPRVVFSKGGFVSLPVVLAAFVLRRKIILHESDSRMGLANSIASKLATRVCVAFPELLKDKKKFILTGNPVREDIRKGNRDEGYKLTGFNSEKPVILVWGGSQGAQKINRFIEEDFENFTRHFQVVHITGAGKGIKKKHRNYCSFDYLNEELRHIYAITDLIVGRAGANSLFEIAYLQIPNIIIPLENTDQLRNAAYFERMNAALVLKSGDKLFPMVQTLWQNRALRKEMTQSLKKLSRPHATEDIVSIILDL